jgi:hypothetical protein
MNIKIVLLFVGIVVVSVMAYWVNDKILVPNSRNPGLRYVLKNSQIITLYLPKKNEDDTYSVEICYGKTASSRHKRILEILRSATRFTSNPPGSRFYRVDLVFFFS